jgi:thioredoxin
MSDAAEHGGINFVKVDVDKHPNIAQEHGVRAMPTFLFFKGGEQSAPPVQGANPRGLMELVSKAKVASSGTNAEGSSL